jgi:ribosomal protein S19E (S16A)
MGVVEKLEKGGRKISKEGQKDLDLIARSVVKTA